MAVGPGATALTVMSRPRSSCARMKVIASTAALLAAYPVYVGSTRPSTEDEKLTIAPPGRTRRAACWSTTKVPRMLVRCIRSRTRQVEVGQRRQRHQAGGVDDDVNAAEGLLGLVEQAGDGVLVGDVGGDRDRLCARGLCFGYGGCRLVLV